MTSEEAGLRLNAAAWGVAFAIFDELSWDLRRFQRASRWAWRLAEHAAYRQYRLGDRAEFLREQREGTA